MTDWMAAAETLNLPQGRAGSGRRSLTSPIDGEAFTEVADHDERDVDAAVSRARAAFEQGAWTGLTPTERKRVLLRWADLMERDRERIGQMDTLAMGMPRALSVNHGVQWFIDALRYYGEAIDKVQDEIAPTGDAVLAMVTREPVGVVGVVLPWNWPIGLAGWKLAPALAVGCSVVVKPDETTPLSLLHAAALGLEAGLPEGVLEVVLGGPRVGEALGRHGDVDVIAFTGSGEVGRSFQRYAGESNMKAVWLECGGKGPNIVFPDAPDIVAAAQASAFAIFLNSGQVCAAGSRLIVHHSIKDAVVEVLSGVAAALQPADPRVETTMMGTMSSARHLDRVADYIGIARDQGGRIVTGGERALVDTGGSYLQPTVIDGVSPDMRVAREEIFGPVLSVLTFDTVDEAVAIANGTAYGLAGGLWTSDLNTALNVSRRLRLGAVGVNSYGEDANSTLVPFGGYRQSGYGRDKSLHALDKYTQIKTTWIKLS
ncbi:aldehyde dehydrogenase family protein [Sphingobium sp.]|uniref:aldehyde dehydrogenase family protein n=1 Tax=Sphingobium sp. TaxID=1912891 RepID=UPI0028BD223F|nr:aldehyde dehydrogenase family protein [Sphingobium sp.]